MTDTRTWAKCREVSSCLKDRLSTHETGAVVWRFVDKPEIRNGKRLEEILTQDCTTFHRRLRLCIF